MRTLLEMSDLRSVPRTDRIDLAPMVEEVLVDLTPLAQKNGITLTQTGENVQFIGSDVLLYRLLFNLTENAIKYNRTGGSVEVSVEQEHGQAAIPRAGYRSGIAEEYRDSIFQPFFRVDKSRSRAMGGVGLGLALVQEIVRLHGGTVRVEQSADTGTTILVTLPLPVAYIYARLFSMLCWRYAAAHIEGIKSISCRSCRKAALHANSIHGLHPL